MVKKRLISVIVLMIVAFVVFCSCARVHTQLPETSETTCEETTQEVPVLPVGTVNPLTGISGFSEAALSQKNIGIVVENYPAARPQWGMSTPDIVVEYEVEGGISRMLWLYADLNSIPAVVGPVRSARHDIAELALGWDLLFVHCGGSNIADQFCAAHPELVNLDSMYNESGFQRDKTRNTATEHRLTLLGEEFRNTLPSRNLNLTANADKKQPFVFAPQNAPRALNGGACNEISVSYSASYNYSFCYNVQSGKYDCCINGEPRVDDGGIQCAYHNVIILHTQMNAVGDQSGHQDLLLESGGEGYYLNGGTAEQIKWIKSDIAEPLRLMTESGEELTLNPGNSYIGFVRSTRENLTVLK